MTLRTYDLKSSECLGLVIKLNIRSSSCHVGSYGNGSVSSCLCNDLSLLLVELGIKYAVWNTPAIKHAGEHLRGLYSDGSDKHRLTLSVGLLNAVANRLEFLLLCLEYRIIKIDSLYRQIGRNNDNIHTVDVSELLLLCLSGTCHTCLLGKLVKEVLEGDGSQCSALTADIYMLLSLDSLMKTVGITASRHNTSGEFINDDNFIILDYIILVSVHGIVCTKSKYDTMLDLKVLRISKVVDMEILLDLMHTLLGKCYILLFLIINVITCLLDLLTEYGVDLGKFSRGFALLHLSRKYIAKLIKLGALA